MVMENTKPDFEYLYITFTHKTHPAQARMPTCITSQVKAQTQHLPRTLNRLTTYNYYFSVIHPFLHTVAAGEMQE